MIKIEKKSRGEELRLDVIKGMGQTENFTQLSASSPHCADQKNESVAITG